MTETTKIFRDKNVRDIFGKEASVMDNVKKLALLPNLEMLSVKQVAEYLQVSPGALYGCYASYREEVEAEGVAYLTGKDFVNAGFTKGKTVKGKTKFRISDGFEINIYQYGLVYFSKGAILRLAMIFKKSTVAEKIRIQLLATNLLEENKLYDIQPEKIVEDMPKLENTRKNKKSSVACNNLSASKRTERVEKKKKQPTVIYDNIAAAQVDTDTSEEVKLMLNIGKATMSGDVQAVNTAYLNAFAFTNKHINQLEKTNQELVQNNKALAGDILEWDERAKLNKAIRLLAAARGIKFGYIWNELFDELLYKHHIGLQMRGDAPYIQHIKEKEWKFVLQSVSAICEKNGVSPNEIFERSKFN